MKKKDTNRIAFVLGGMSNGGAERVVSLLANHYSKKGKSVDILMLLNSESTYTLNPNIRLINLSSDNKPRIFQFAHWISGIRRYYKINRPYRIVSFFAKINIIVLLSLFKNISDIIVSERNDPSKDGRGRVVKFLTQILYPKTKKVIFQTRWAQSCFKDNVINNSEIVENPVTEIPKQNVKKTKTIVNVGKLSDQKNHVVLIKAFSKIADNFQDYNLIIYGEGANRKKLESLTSSLNLENRVELPGWQSDVHKRVAEAELFVLSSNYEGFSNALLEAMMLGVPCISTNCAGSNEIIEDQLNGILVPINNVDSLSYAMKKLLSNPQLSLEIGRKGKKDVERFGVSKITNRWERVID